MDASGKVGIIQATVQTVAAFGAEFGFFKAFAAAAAAVILRIPVCTFHAYAVVTAIHLAFIKAAICANAAVAAQFIFFKAAIAGLTAVRSIIPVAAKTAASAASADSVVFFGAIIAQFAGIVVFIFAAVTFRTVCIRPAVLTPVACRADGAVRNTVDAPFAAHAEFVQGFTLVAGGQTLLANDFQTAGKSCTAGLAQFLLRKVSLAVKTSQTGVAVRTNGAVRLPAVFAYVTVAADIPAALSAIFAVFVFAAVDTIPAFGAVFVFAHFGKTFAAAVAMSGFIAFAVGTVLRAAAAVSAAIAVPMVVSAAAAVLTVGIIRKRRKRQKRQRQHKRHEQR